MGEMLSAHSASQSSWLCHITSFFSLSTQHTATHTHIPTTSLLVLYLHTDPLG